jgi:hypothetical protein
MPTRIQRRRTAGWRAPAGAIYVGRGPGSRYGNPWSATEHGREGATRRFRAYLEARRTPRPGWMDLIGYPSDDDIRAELAGRDLMCWCPLPAEGEPDHCHAGVLLEWANQPEAANR